MSDYERCRSWAEVGRVVTSRRPPRGLPHGTRGQSHPRPLLVAQQGDVTCGVPAQRYRHRQIQHDLARIVHRQRPPPGPAPSRELLRQPAAPGVLHQQHATGVRDQRFPPAITDNQGRRPLSFTHEVPLIRSDQGLEQLRSNRAEQALSRISTPRVAHKINYDESPRLVRFIPGLSRTSRIT